MSLPPNFTATMAATTKGSVAPGDFGTAQWSELFASLGLSDAQMWQWHQLFEQRYPEQHQAFLRWLGVDAADAAVIRERALRGDA